MLATAETGGEFTRLNEAAKQAVSRVFADLDDMCSVVDIPGSPAADFRLLPEHTVGVVEHGFLSVLAGNTIVSVLDQGDLVLPDAEKVGNLSDPLRYGSDQGARVRLWAVSDVMEILRRDEVRHSDWLSALTLTQSLTMRLTAIHLKDMVGGGDASRRISPGKVIIQQGDPAGHIYFLLEGEADVLVNDHVIALVRPGEMFGTMAALTRSHRNATVKAKTNCTVIEMPVEHFFEMIRSYPAAVEKLLIDMANSISDLNAEVVNLRRRLKSS